jgi:UDP-2,4-diacetamido-2,4,6-trideoxy-beta-L-altropyranose hydrolase
MLNAASGSVVFRVDASRTIGSGHATRCLTLADALASRGFRSTFLMADTAGSVLDEVARRGHILVKLRAEDPESSALEALRSLGRAPEWLVVDSYGIERTWETEASSCAARLMVVDDLANRSHQCDLLLDQNFYLDLQSRYAGLVPQECVTLLGPGFALLRREFGVARDALPGREGTVRRVLTFFGGSDVSRLSARALEALRIADLGVEVDAILGDGNEDAEALRSVYGNSRGVRLWDSVQNMATMMASADLAIGAGGATTWERCFLGLPSLAVVVADNQAETTAAVASVGATVNLGWHESVTAEQIATELVRAVSNPDALAEMSKLAQQLVGDTIGTERVVDAMCSTT